MSRFNHRFPRNHNLLLGWRTRNWMLGGVCFVLLHRALIGISLHRKESIQVKWSNLEMIWDVQHCHMMETMLLQERMVFGSLNQREKGSVMLLRERNCRFNGLEHI